MGGDDVPGMDQPVKRAGALGEVRVVGIVRADPIQNQVEAVGEVGNARPEAVQVEPVLDVRPLDLAEHLVALEAAEPLDPRLVVAGRRGILVVGHPSFCKNTLGILYNLPRSQSRWLVWFGCR